MEKILWTDGKTRKPGNRKKKGGEIPDDRYI
jgi:hypothetical protein